MRGAGRGIGIGAAVCGAPIEPVISALARSKRSLILSLILAICECADLLAASMLVFSVVISLAMAAIDCCIALVSGRPETSMRAGGARPRLASGQRRCRPARNQGDAAVDRRHGQGNHHAE